MKKFNKIFGMTAMAAAAFSFASCQNGLDEYVPGGNTSANGVSLVRTPDVIAWSGQQLIGNTIVPTPSNVITRAANVNGNMWDQNWDCVDNVYPALTKEDLAEIKRLLSPGHEEENEVILPFENYWVQQVYKGEDTYRGENKQDPPQKVGEEVLGSDHMNKLIAWNPHTETIYGDPANNYQPYEGTVNYEHINNFNSGGNQTTYGTCGCGIAHTGTTLMTGMPTSGINANEQFGFHETWGTEHDYNNYLIIEYKGYYYVGFDYEAHKYDQTSNNVGEAYNIERDWNFTDWIVRITPAYHKGSTPIFPDNEEDSSNGDGNTGSGNTGGNENNGGNTDNGGNVTNRHGNEVEVNYAILDSHQQYNLADLVTKLSIHVRKATDVKIEIPIPAKYLVDSDDLFIFNDHSHFVYNERPHSVTYNVGGKIVSLTVTIANDAITVVTDGIDQSVIDYCWETNQDGINFEVYNYFQTEKALWNQRDEFAAGVPSEINREHLYEAMNGAKISFLDVKPTYYINAFGFNDDKTDRHDWHATVMPAASEGYDLKYEQTDHLNGTPCNDIYLLRGASEDVYHEHPEAI